MLGSYIVVEETGAAGEYYSLTPSHWELFQMPFQGFEHYSYIEQLQSLATPQIYRPIINTIGPHSVRDLCCFIHSCHEWFHGALACAFNPYDAWWLFWPIQNDEKNLEIDWNPGIWLLIWESSAKGLKWIPKWQGLDGFQII